MFTGIIEEIGQVRSLNAHAGGYRIVVGARTVLEGTRTGDSIAVNGICLTVVALPGTAFEADVMPETWRRSALSALRPGSPVNLERALLPTTRLGGHLVSGHIDGTARLVERRTDGNSLWLVFETDPTLLRYVAFKGSVALDGTSLTVAAVTERSFSVGLIPETQERTTLSRLAVGDQVNLETDLLAKYVERLLGVRDPRKTLDWDDLKRYGYA